jgi:hypothetical protein
MLSYLVSIATGYGLGDRDLIPVRDKFFFSPYCPDRLWGPPNFLSSGYRGLFPRGVKLTTPSSSSEVKNGGAISPLHRYAFMALRLINYSQEQV